MLKWLMVNVGYPGQSISPTLRESSMLSGLGGDADDAGDVSEYDGDGVLGVGGVSYTAWWGLEEGGVLVWVVKDTTAHKIVTGMYVTGP